MRRKIKFPLIMKGGVEVRNIEELRENFDLEKVINYYLEGKLQRWLQDRNYEEELSKIKELNTSSGKISEELCILLDVEYKKDKTLDIQSIAYRNDKVTKLRDYLEDEKINEIIDYVALNQEELIDFIKNNKKVIYLYNGEYSIDFDKKNIKYIGIGEVLIKIKESDNIDLDNRNIVLENVKLESKSNITIISKKSRNINFNENIIYKFNNYEDYEVIIDKRFINEDTKEGKILDELGYLEDFKDNKWGFIIKGLYKINKNSNEKELVEDNFVSVEACCKYEDKVFYIGNDVDSLNCYIYKINLDGTDKEKLLETKFEKKLLREINNNDIDSNDKYIAYRGEEGIYICTHNGENNNFFYGTRYTTDFKLMNNYIIIYNKSIGSSSGDMKIIDIDTKNNIIVQDKVSIFLKTSEYLFYVLVDGFFTYEKIVYKMNILTFEKTILKKFYDEKNVFDRELEYKENVLYYRRYNQDRNTDLEDKIIL